MACIINTCTIAAALFNIIVHLGPLKCTVQIQLIRIVLSLSGLNRFCETFNIDVV